MIDQKYNAGVVRVEEDAPECFCDLAIVAPDDSRSGIVASLEKVIDISALPSSAEEEGAGAEGVRGATPKARQRLLHCPAQTVLVSEVLCGHVSTSRCHAGPWCRKGIASKHYKANNPTWGDSIRPQTDIGKQFFGIKRFAHITSIPRGVIIVDDKQVTCVGARRVIWPTDQAPESSSKSHTSITVSKGGRDA